MEKIKAFILCPPIRFLQTIDIHYESSNSNDYDSLLSSLKTQISDIHNNKINAIAINGDIASKNPSVELSLFEKTMTELIKVFNEGRIFMVAGNHEMLWNAFNHKRISNHPYLGYVTLYNNIYSKSIISSTVAKNNLSGKLSKDINSDDLTWHRSIQKHKVSIIGICSNPDDNKNQGRGLL